MNRYVISVSAGSERDADLQARALADYCREITGIEEVRRKKNNETTMDLGAIVEIVSTSAATLALAHGLADWLRLRRSTNLSIEQDSDSGSIKILVENIDADTAARIAESVRRQK